jgi:hypothetical protein
MTTEEIQVQEAPEEPMEAAGTELETPEAAPTKRPLVNVAALVRGVDVELQNAMAGAVIAADDVSLQKGGARSIFAGGNLELRQGGAGVIVAGGDTSITQGGAQAIVSAGGVMMERSGSGFAIGRRIRIGHNGLAIFAVTPNLEVQEGGRVVFGRGASFAILGGMMGVALLMVGLLRGRRR